MAYTHFDETTPAPTQNGTEVCDSTRANLLAIRDMAIAGLAFGWNGTPSGGTAEQPAVITLARGTERIRKTCTWGTVGGATGNPEEVLVEYSSDSGLNYSTVGTVTFAYDVNGNVLPWTWS